MSLKFSPEGTLSSAFLIIGEERRDVSNQLPGITWGTSDLYVLALGFRTSWSPVEKALGRELGGELVESIEGSRDDGFSLLVIRDEKERWNASAIVDCFHVSSEDLLPDT